MLGKLLKYDLKGTGRLLLPLYAALLGVALLLGIYTGVTSGADFLGKSNGFLAVIMGIVYVALIAVCVVMTLVLIIQGFSRNLLGNRGYLMFALPVRTRTHVTAKTISGALWGVLGTVTGLLSVFLIVLLNQGPTSVFSSINGLFNQFFKDNGGLWILVSVIELILLVLIVSGETVVKIYAAIAVGHMWQEHRVLGAILAYIGFGVVEATVLNTLQAIGLKLFNLPDFLAKIHPIWGDNLVVLFLMLVTVVLGLIYWFVTGYILERRLNLE